MDITKEFLVSKGFDPFCEDGELQFYQKFIKAGTISFEPGLDGPIYYGSKWWLRVQTTGSNSITLHCPCETVERYYEIMESFNLFSELEKSVLRGEAKKFIVDNRIVTPKCKFCQRKACSDFCEQHNREELVELVLTGKINEENKKEYQ